METKQNDRGWSGGYAETKACLKYLESELWTNLESERKKICCKSQTTFWNLGVTIIEVRKSVGDCIRRVFKMSKNEVVKNVFRLRKHCPPGLDMSSESNDRYHVQKIFLGRQNGHTYTT